MQRWVPLLLPEQGGNPLVQAVGDALMFQSAPRRQAAVLPFVETGEVVEFIAERFPFVSQASQQAERVEDAGNPGDGAHRGMIAAAVPAVMAQIEGRVAFGRRRVDDGLGRLIAVMDVGQPLRILPQ